MKNRMEEAKNAMFAHAEDPQNSKWWDVAWETLHDTAFGPVINKKTPVIEEALWLMELRNIHSAFESVFYGWEYDPMWIDWLEATGVEEQEMTAFLKQVNKFEEDDTLKDALHTYCWEKRQTVFDTLIKRFENESHLFDLFMGGKMPRDRDRAQAVYGWIDEGFDC